MVTLDRKTTSSYIGCQYSTYVFICSGLGAILNAKLLPAAMTQVRRINFPKLVKYCQRSAVTSQTRQVQQLICYIAVPYVYGTRYDSTAMSLSILMSRGSWS